MVWKGGGSAVRRGEGAFLGDEYEVDGGEEAGDAEPAQ